MSGERLIDVQTTMTPDEFAAAIRGERGPRQRSIRWQVSNPEVAGCLAVTVSATCLADGYDAARRGLAEQMRRTGFHARREER